MLHPPYTRYDRLHVYHLDVPEIPAIRDPDHIGTWMEDGSAILFFHRPKEQLIDQLCRDHKCNVIYQADLDYSDWEAGQTISSFTVDDFTVSPIWEDTPAQVRLDPSVIFGSGFHPSTRLCLQALLKYLRTPEVSINSLVDLGTGTGLLAVAAAIEGVQKVTAVDYNPLACEVAIQNAALNNVDSAIDIQQADIRSQLPNTRVDLVIANLYQGLLVDLFNNSEFWRAQLYILAGFIPSMEPRLLAALPDRQVRFLERGRRDKWCYWVMSKI